MEYKVLMIQLLVLPVKVSALFPNPAYTSDWHFIKSNGGNESAVTIQHNLNTLPVKVLAEVRVNTTSGYMIFPADMGSANRDDDDWEMYGGIVTLYNENTVFVLAANAANNQLFLGGLVVFTGDNGWQGPNLPHSYSEAEVRVKVWLKENFPTPDFESPWEPISVDDDPTYKEIQHNLSGYPSFITLQVKSGGFTFEAQGFRSRQTYNIWSQFGGVVYGFSDSSVRIWYLASTKFTSSDSQKAFILSTGDGWGDHSNVIYRTSGEFKVIAWRFPERWVDTIVTTPETLRQNDYKMMLQEKRRYINVEVEANDGYNDGFRFYGVGSAVTDGAFGPIGGLIYSYSSQTAWFWWPKNSHGNILQLGDIMSYNMSHQSSNNVLIRINNFFNTEVMATSTYQQMKSNKDVVPVSSVLWSMTTTQTDCCRKCTYDVLCKSVFYHLNDSLCIGNEYQQLSNMATQTYPGMKHYVEVVSTI